MRLEYEPTIEERAEPSIRLFSRSETFKKQRIRSMVLSAIIPVGFAYLLTLDDERSVFYTLSGLCVVFALSFSYIIYPKKVSNGIRRHVERELKKREPGSTIYRIEDEKIHCESLESTTSFKLSSLTEVTEDETYLELTFGTAGLCTVPIRIFKDSQQKADFIKAAKGEQVGGHNSGGCAPSA